MTISKWKDKKPHPPSWVVEAFSLMGENYEYIENSVVYHIDRFLIEVVDEVETSLQGTQDKLNSDCILTAHQQRVAFFRAAIWHADYFRPRNVQRKDGKPIHSHKATDDMRDQQDLRQKIAETSSVLAKFLRRHKHITERLGGLQLDCDPFELVTIMDRRADQQNLPGYLEGIRDEFNYLVVRRGPPHHAEQNLAYLLEALAEKACDAHPGIFPPDVRMGIDGHKHTSHFYTAFDIWLSEHCEETGGFIPANFRLSDKCWAALGIGLFGVDVSDKDIDGYRRNWKERMGQIPAIDPTLFWPVAQISDQDSNKKN